MDLEGAVRQRSILWYKPNHSGVPSFQMYSQHMPWCGSIAQIEQVSVKPGNVVGIDPEIKFIMFLDRVGRVPTRKGIVAVYLSFRGEEKYDHQPNTQGDGSQQFDMDVICDHDIGVLRI